MSREQKRVESNSESDAFGGDSLFSELMDQHGDGFVLLDEDGLILFANEAARKLLGRTRADLSPGKPIDLPAELHGPDGHAVVARGKVGPSIDYRLKEVHVDGRTARLLCIRDVTQDLRRLKHLEKLERRGRLIVAEAAEGIIVVQDGILKFHNPMVKRVLGYSDEQLQRMALARLIHQDDVAAINDFEDVMLTTSEAPATYITRILTSEHTVLWVEVKATRIEWQSRPAALCFLTDVTNRVHAEQDRMLLATAVEQAVEAILVTDAQGRVEYVNSAFEGLTGFSRAEVLGRSPQILYGGEGYRDAYKQIWEAINRGEIWNGRFQNKKKDGTVYEEDTTVSPVFDDNHELTHFVILKRDVTAQVNLERALRNAQRMEAMGTLAGGIAHDFNNSLALILGRCELGINALPPEHPAASQFESIFKAGQRAAGIVKQILVFCRQAEQEKRALMIGLVVREAVELLRTALPKNIEIKVAIDKCGGRVLSDPSQVHQVVMNLCTNAFHAMGEKGGVLTVNLEKVTLDAHRYADAGELHPGDYMLLTVGDTGTGMDRATIQRIFDPFFTTKEPDKGTGLGLATVHGIVTGCEGAIQVESQPGKGTTFKLYFPCCEEKAVQEHPTAHDSLAGTERILVVDDDADFVEMYQALLAQHGYRVTAFTRGADALAHFKKDPEAFDVVITDHIMPGMSGLELAQKLLAIRPGMPILLSTGLGRQNANAAVPDPGISERLFKPTPLRELVAAIRRAIARNGA